ncbi:rod-determining factor RdfA [Halosolutus amylolyticus]|uniref:Rod-determining factor RdfA n=1 Tax=Halosolutus amylolyticus TaxID=2932267 RepID=A0ABD5PM29_9EURY|nr:rod-determining factor RdfA [Halosolutus amylolyticus]
MAPEYGCKVDATIDRYDLETADPRHESLHDGLLARWTGDDGHSEVGYRRLTEWFNKRLLKRVYDEHGREAHEARIDADYEALTGDDDLVREETTERLSAAGIDGEALLEDMVSWGTMRTHLNDCLEGSKDRSGARTDWERDSVAVAREVVTEKVDEALSSLATKGELAGTDSSSVEVQIHLRCDECPTRVPLEVALDRGYVCDEHSETSANTETHA